MKGEEKPFIIVPRDFFRAQDGLKLRVLGEMIGRADAEGRCHPSHARIAADLDASRARVTRAILELEQDGSIKRLNKKKPARYQIAERFLVRLSPHRPARSAKGTDQPSLLLPISGSAPPMTGVRDGVQKTPSRAGPMVSNRHPHGVQKTPGRESTKSKNLLPNTESGAARAREAAEIVGRVSKNAGLVGAARRSGPNLADPAVRRARWMSNCIEQMQLHWPAAEYRRAMTVIVEDAESPAAKRLLERASSERQALMAKRGRACSAGVKLRRSPRRRALRKRRA